jgi:hypothetical protein
MASKGLQNRGIFCPFFEHLRGSFDEVVFEITRSPLCVPSENAMQQMPVFVEENNYVVAFHQPRAVGGLGKVTNQHVLRQPKSFFAGGQVERGIVLVFVGTREHIKVNPAKQLAAIENVVNRNIRMPDLRRGYAFVSDAIHLAGKVEDSL